MRYTCPQESDDEEHILIHTLKHHDKKISLRRLCLQTTTGVLGYQSVQFDVLRTDVNKRIDDEFRPYIDIEEEPIKYKRKHIGQSKQTDTKSHE